MIKPVKLELEVDRRTIRAFEELAAAFGDAERAMLRAAQALAQAGRVGVGPAEAKPAGPEETKDERPE